MVGRTGESTRQEDERGAVRDGGALTKDSANESRQRDHTTTSALGRPQAPTRYTVLGHAAALADDHATVFASGRHTATGAVEDGPAELGGQVDLMFDSLTIARQLTEAGMKRA